MTWEIEVSKEAERLLDKLAKSDKKTLNLIYKKLMVFAENPRQFGKALTGDKQGIWRYRVGDYRILCQLKDKKLIMLVLIIDHRKDVYR